MVLPEHEAGLGIHLESDMAEKADEFHVVAI